MLSQQLLSIRPFDKLVVLGLTANPHDVEPVGRGLVKIVFVYQRRILFRDTIRLNGAMQGPDFERSTQSLLQITPTDFINSFNRRPFGGVVTHSANSCR
jgi:hypothetical protein